MIPTEVLSFPTVWQLRAACPRCRRPSALCLVTCPTCLQVAVICAAERVAFPSFAQLGSGGGVDPDVTSCRHCHDVKIRDFPPAMPQQIRAAGIDLQDCVEFSLQRLILETANTSVDRRERRLSRLVRTLTVLDVILGVMLALAGIALIVFYLGRL
jgi:hypothetical protein